jgi:hypothetical protein
MNTLLDYEKSIEATGTCSPRRDLGYHHVDHRRRGRHHRRCSDIYLVLSFKHPIAKERLEQEIEENLARGKPSHQPKWAETKCALLSSPCGCQYGLSLCGHRSRSRNWKSCRGNSGSSHHQLIIGWLKFLAKYLQTPVLENISQILEGAGSHIDKSVSAGLARHIILSATDCTSVGHSEHLPD